MAFEPKNLVKIFEAGNPFRNDPANAAAYYATIGRIAVVWGRFEQSLEQAIWAMSNAPGSPKPRQAPPVSFKRKLERIKLLCRDVPSLRHLHEHAREFSSTAIVLGRKRHDLTHANWQGFTKDAPEPTVAFSNIRWDSEHGTYDKRSIPLSELDALLAEIIKTNEVFFEKLLNEAFAVVARASRRSSRQA
jgi:hypothetical protein